MATRKVRKFDDGGSTGRTIVQPGPGARIPPGMANASPAALQRMAVDDAYRQVRQAGRQYAIGSPERQNFRNYMQSLPDKSVAMAGSGAPKLAAFNPQKTYKAGGAVSASKRADGIAQRGKTKGRMR